jgi:hypothetical protein
MAPDMRYPHLLRPCSFIVPFVIAEDEDGRKKHHLMSGRVRDQVTHGSLRILWVAVLFVTLYCPNLCPSPLAPYHDVYMFSMHSFIRGFPIVREGVQHTCDNCLFYTSSRNHKGELK